MSIESDLESLSINEPPPLIDNEAPGNDDSPPEPQYPLTGACACRKLRYTLHAPPLIVHCCHCTECQCQSGGPFVINALIEHFHVTHSEGDPELIHCPAVAEGGQTVARCKECKIAIWSNYAQAGELVRFVRVGTLDRDPTGKDKWKGHLIRPEAHIYTSTKVPWIVLPEGVKVFEGLYDAQMTWSPESLERMGKLMKEAGKT